MDKYVKWRSEVSGCLPYRLRSRRHSWDSDSPLTGQVSGSNPGLSFDSELKEISTKGCGPGLRGPVDRDV